MQRGGNNEEFNFGAAFQCHFSHNHKQNESMEPKRINISNDDEPNVASKPKTKRKIHRQKRILPSWIQMRYLNSPHGVVGPLPDPVRHRAILLQLLAQLALDDKRLVGTLHRGVSNSRSLLFHIGIL